MEKEKTKKNGEKEKGEETNGGDAISCKSSMKRRLLRHYTACAWIIEHGNRNPYSGFRIP